MGRKIFSLKKVHIDNYWWQCYEFILIWDNCFLKSHFNLKSLETKFDLGKNLLGKSFFWGVGRILLSDKTNKRFVMSGYDIQLVPWARWSEWKILKEHEKNGYVIPCRWMQKNEIYLKILVAKWSDHYCEACCFLLKRGNNV